MCGIFGFLLLDDAQYKHVYTLLDRMIWVTMVRGAQSGGVLTYAKQGSDLRGIRSRVLNGKRTNLSKLLPKAVKKDVRHAQLWTPRIYQGHTRFATSTIADLDGTHPHRWSDPKREQFWTFGDSKHECRTATMELYICHNGDFDCFKFNEGHTEDLHDLQAWLARATGCKAPCQCDSAAIAGMLDIIFAQGCWYRAVRFAFHMAVARNNLDYDIPEDQLEACAQALENAFVNGRNRNTLVEMASDFDIDCIPLHPPQVKKRFATAAVNAFFENDLLKSVTYFLDRAMGSFGLCVTTSVAPGQICLAARGQPLSVAFYNDCGAVLFASELNAVKAGMSVLSGSQDAVRMELDHIGGEICLIDAGPGFLDKPEESTAQVETRTMLRGCARFTMVREHPDMLSPHHKWTQLYNNSLVIPLPEPCADPVGSDIADIPQAVESLIQDWHNGYNSSNRLTAWSWGRAILDHLENPRREGDHVDILVVGCEASLWVGEQFASDLKLVFPKLCIQATSSNKILGLYGQDHAMYQTGFHLSEEGGGWVLCDTIILLISHSGSSFATLLCTSLLRCFSQHTFIVTSEQDTLMGKEVKDDSGKLKSMFSKHIFSTNVGFRPAEPVTVSFAATHVLLSLLLEYTMLVFLRAQVHKENVMDQVGASFTKLDAYMYIEHMNRLPATLRGIVEGPSSKDLRYEGKRLANHVLEAPRVWIMVAIYVFVTVFFKAPAVGFLCGFFVDDDDLPTALDYVIQALDALIYIFCAQIAYLALRLVQGRKLFHRMVGRSVLIADVPMVGQVVRAFASKCFACTYSNTEVNFYNGSPTDHFLHRFTHQTRRGSLLVVGRPDGRLADLTAAESATCLAVTQACSIQNYGVTAEAITIGHNPYALGSAHSHIVLPTTRPAYLCEDLITGTHNSPAVIIGKLKNCAISATKSAELQAEEMLHGQDDVGSTPYDVDVLVDDPKQPEASPEGTGETLSTAVATNDTGLTTNDTPLTAYSCDIPKITCGDVGTHQVAGTEAVHAMQETPIGDLGRTAFIQRHKTSLRMSSVSNLSQYTDGDCPTDKMAKAGFEGVIDRQLSVRAVFGDYLRRKYPERGTPELLVKQRLSIRLYEGRFATLERSVAFFVLFHEMAKRVEKFWAFFWWLGLGYNIESSQSHCRVMTTASPVSGMDVLDSMVVMKHLQQQRRALTKIRVILGPLIKVWRYRRKPSRSNTATSVQETAV